MARRISRQQHLRGIFQTQYEVGICGTCGEQAAATPENEGYSDCCLDRIEYGMEAAETVQRVIRETQETIVQNRKRIASLASTLSKGNKGRKNLLSDADFDRIEAELKNLRQWQKINKADLKRLQKIDVASISY